MLLQLRLTTTGASIQVDTINSGSIEEILVDSVIVNYAINDVINFSSNNASAKVSVVNGGIAPESNTTGNIRQIILY